MQDTFVQFCVFVASDFRPMKSYQRLGLFVLNLTVVSLVVVGVGMTMLYRVALDREKHHLSEIALDRARILAAVYDRTRDLPSPSERLNATVDRMAWEVTTDTVKVLRRDNGLIFLFQYHHSEIPPIQSRQEHTNWTESMRQALRGESGTTIVRHEGGIASLSAYQPVPDLPWGVVVRLDLQKLRTSFLNASYYTLAIAFVLDLIGAFLCWYLTDPEIRKICRLNQALKVKVRERTADLTQLKDDLKSEICEHRRIEAILRETTDRSEAIWKHVSEGIVVFSTDRQIAYANTAAARLTGYHSVNDMVTDNRCVASQCEVLDENSRIVDLDRLPHILAFQDRTSSSQTLQIVDCQTQEERWVVVKATPIFHDDSKLHLVIVTMHDITARAKAETALRDSEARYRRIVESASEGLWAIDADAIVTFVNTKMAKMLGYSVDEILGRSLFEFMDEEGRDFAAQKLAHRRLDTCEQYDLKLCCRDGSELWTIVSTTPAFDMTDGSLGALSVTVDITERKIAEEALRESEERFRALFDRAAVAMALLTLDGRFFRVNPKFCDFSGYTRPELLELRIPDITHPADLNLVRHNLKQLSEENENKSYTLEHRCVCKNGSIVWVNFTISLVQASDGLSRYLLGILLDITDRKKTLQERDNVEAALRQSEERFRTLVRTAGSAIIALSSDKHIVEWNREAERLCGWTRETMLGEDYFTLCVPPVWRNNVAAQFNLVLAGESVREFEHPVLNADGNQREVLWNFNRWYNAQSQRWEIVACGQDITERQQAQKALRESVERFRAIFEQIAVGVAYVDGHGKIVTANQKFAHICGCRPEELKAKSVEQLVHPDDRADWSDWTGRLLSDELATFSREIRYVRRDGDAIWVNFTASVLRDALGHPESLLYAIEDISDRKYAEVALQQANQKLVANVSELKRRHQELVGLGQMNEFLQACSSLREAYETLGNLMYPLFPGCSGGLFLVRPESEELEAVSTWGETSQTMTAFAPHDCWALRLGHLHWSQEASTGLRCHHIRDDPPPVEFLCVPTVAQGETLGLLHVQSDEVGNLTEAKRQFARTVAEQLALALSNLQLRETLKHQSIRDPLTGLYNRRYLEETLDREFRRAAREGYPISIVMLDIDRFKQFNDTFGHEAGDAVLEALGEFLIGCVRGSDIACRYGGEELTLVLPGASLDIAYERAEKLRQGICQLQVFDNGRFLGTVTASLGVAEFPACGETWEVVLHAADTALYRAKAAGRNRVIVATTVTS
ncbi:MAG: PAS domain S-box protein [Cyanobacteria bacterium SBC]|nr:PAS domain S-box protein [Cyanobacteria bacterium SBC]